jgi:hypothetical protein
MGFEERAEEVKRARQLPPALLGGVKLGSELNVPEL